MLNVLIVDDEPPARRRMRRLVEAVDGCAVAGEAPSADAALDRIGEGDIDVVLLDISMPGLDGMALARTLTAQDPSPAVIFCTADPERALDAFEAAAVDYLVKPVRRERLEAALTRARRVVGEGDSAYLRSTVGGRTQLVAVDRVVCLLSEDKYTTVLHEDGESVVNDSLIEIENRFPDRFLRVHRGALVSKHCIRGLERLPDGGHRLILAGTDARPPVSRRQLPAVRKSIGEMT
jgi:two-component system response regulator AlgR